MKERLTFDAAVAGSGRLVLDERWLRESSWHVLFHALLYFRFDLGTNALGGAVDH